MNCATRMLNENDLGVEAPTNETFQRIKQMFPRRRQKQANLPTPDPRCTTLSHIKPRQVLKAVQTFQGSGGVSHLDAKSFKRMLVNKAFRQEADRILNALAETTSKIATSSVDGDYTAPMRAVRMIAVRKPSGGIRPVGVGEVARRIITKIIARETRNEIKEATGSIQCQGLKGACEAAIGAMDELYESGKTLLILDAEGAFNNLSRTSTLKTAAQVVPEAYQSMLNFYGPPTRAYHGPK